MGFLDYISNLGYAIIGRQRAEDSRLVTDNRLLNKSVIEPKNDSTVGNLSRSQDQGDKYIRLKLGGRIPGRASMELDVIDIDNFFTSKGLIPVHHDTSVEPTCFGSRVYHYNDCSVVVSQAHIYSSIYGAQGNVETVFREMVSEGVRVRSPRVFGLELADEVPTAQIETLEEIVDRSNKTKA